MACPHQFVLIHLEHSFSSDVIGCMTSEPNYQEGDSSRWSIFGYHYPHFLVNFRLSKPDMRWFSKDLTKTEHCYGGIALESPDYLAKMAVGRPL